MSAFHLYNCYICAIKKICPCYFRQIIFCIQVADLREQLKVKNEEVDAIVGTVNDKVEEWKSRLAEKDKALLENAKTITILQDRINAAALDEDRIKVERLTAVSLIPS